MPEPSLPHAVFAVEDADPPSVPRGRSARRAAVLISEGGQNRFGARIGDSLKRGGVDAVTVLFGGECSEPTGGIHPRVHS
jgi:hypothetical protein